MKHLAFAVLLFGAKAIGFEIKYHQKNLQFNLVANTIDELPGENLKKSFSSGFTNQIYVHLFVEKDKKEFLKKEIEYKVNYDLWDEIYIVQKRYGQEATTAKYNNFQDVINEFKSIRFYNLLNADSLKVTEQLTFQVKIIIDPISKEKQKKIKTWLAENNVNLPSTSDVANQGKKADKSGDRKPADHTSSGTTSSALFNKILDSEFENEATAAAWSYSSPRLKLKDIGSLNEK